MENCSNLQTGRGMTEIHVSSVETWRLQTYNLLSWVRVLHNLELLVYEAKHLLYLVVENGLKLSSGVVSVLFFG
jgi:hypothetical protein